MTFVLGFIFALIPPIVAVIMVITRGTGRAKTLGLIGFIVVAFIGIIAQLMSLFMPRIVASLGLGSYQSVLIGWSVLAMLLQLGAMIILALAVTANRTSDQPQQFAPPPQQYSPQAYGYVPPTWQ